MRSTIFTNAQVFDGTSRDLYLAEVEVRDRRIHAVAPGIDILPRWDADIIDCGGATLMPGLINTHCHPSYTNATSNKAIAEMPVEEHVLATAYNVKLLLDSGFTALVGAGSAKPRLDLVIRNEVDAGRLPGPRMLAASPELTVTGGLADDSRYDDFVPSVSLVRDGAEAFRKTIRALIREGVDIVKFCNSGDSFCYPSVAADRNPMTEDEVRAICETTLNLGRRLAAHAHADSSILECIKYGVEFIYHATFASEKTIEALERVKDRHYVTPCIAARYNTMFEAKDWGITTEVATKIGTRREFEMGVETIRKLHQAGIKVLPFGDYGFAWIPHGSDTRDFVHFTELFGFEPWEVLRAATAYGGEAFGVDKMGQIRPGYLADILLIKGNPLLDLTLFQDRNNLLAIMKDGVFHKEYAPARSRVEHLEEVLS